VKRRTLYLGLAVLGGIALLGVAGALEPVATVLAAPEQLDRVTANAAALQGGALRLLLVVLAAGAVLLAIDSGKVRGAAATAILALVTVADLWSVDRLFFDFKAPASVLFRDDALVQRIKQVKPPFRVFDPSSVYGQMGSILAAHDVQQVLGYHGNEVRFYDELLGGKNVWKNVGNPAVLDLIATRFLVLRQEAQLPGFHKVLGPVEVAPGGPGVLFERDSATRYLRVFGAAAKVPDDQVVPTVIDPRFPLDHIVLYSDTAGVTPESLRPNQPIPTTPVRAEMAEWAPGEMRIALTGADTRPNYLLVSENWYPDWHAKVDGKPAAVHRADNTLISVVLPPGARSVDLSFESSAYTKGKWVSALSIVLALGLCAWPLIFRPRTARA
jgi:hypothetical protein